VRSIFNSKIHRITKQSRLTQKITHTHETEICKLGQGQIFGEARFIKIYERAMKASERLGGTAGKSGEK